MEKHQNPIIKKIYDIIWKRTIASQMIQCIMDVLSITINIDKRNEKFLRFSENKANPPLILIRSHCCFLKVAENKD